MEQQFARINRDVHVRTRRGIRHKFPGARHESSKTERAFRGRTDQTASISKGTTSLSMGTIVRAKSGDHYDSMIDEGVPQGIALRELEKR